MKVHWHIFEKNSSPKSYFYYFLLELETKNKEQIRPKSKKNLSKISSFINNIQKSINIARPTAINITEIIFLTKTLLDISSASI